MHSIGLLVPVWNIFVLYWLYRDVDELRRWYGLPEIPVGGYVVGGALAPAFMYSVALGKVNELWDVRTQGLATEAPTTSSETVLLSLGAAAWALWIAWLVLSVLFLFGAGPLVDVV